MIVLDTHAWIWWVSDPDKLSTHALSAVDYADKIGICPISCWEIATKVAQGKLTIDRDVRIWMKQALARPRIELVPISVDIAVSAAFLGAEGFHGDPADRLIVATARIKGSYLVTKDKSIRSFAGVQSIW